VWFAVHCWLVNWQIFVLLLISSSSSKQLSIFICVMSAQVFRKKNNKPTSSSKQFFWRLGLFQWLDWGLRQADILIFWGLLFNSGSGEMWTECQFIGKWTEPFQSNHNILSYLLWIMSMMLWVQSLVLIAYILWLFLVNYFMYSYVQPGGLQWYLLCLFQILRCGYGSAPWGARLHKWNAVPGLSHPNDGVSE
jgi:hypothetical protein